MPKTNVKAASKNINKYFKTQQAFKIVSAKDLKNSFQAYDSNSTTSLYLS